MRTVLGIVAVVAVVAGTCGSAVANTLHCGDTITHDTKLEADLTGCVGNGLLIGASNVTLDLNGHTISAEPSRGGAGVGYPSHPTPSALTNITVENGTIEGFYIGTEVPLHGSGLLRKLTLTDNGIALETDGRSIAIRHNDVSGSTWGIECFCDASAITQNRVSAVHGIYAGGSEDLISHNEVRGSSLPFDINPENGIEFGSAGSGSVISHNTVTHATNDGIFATVFGSSTGTVIAHNTANDNGNLGIEADPSTVDGGHNRASGNGNPAQCVSVRCRG